MSNCIDINERHASGMLDAGCWPACWTLDGMPDAVYLTTLMSTVPCSIQINVIYKQYYALIK